MINNSKLPFIVSWVRWDRTRPQWRPIFKWQRCRTLDKAERLKKLLLSQAHFIDVYITKEVKYEGS